MEKKGKPKGKLVERRLLMSRSPVRLSCAHEQVASFQADCELGLDALVSLLLGTQQIIQSAKGKEIVNGLGIHPFPTFTSGKQKLLIY